MSKGGILSDPALCFPLSRRSALFQSTTTSGST